jgi:hypothetical protein
MQRREAQLLAILSRSLEEEQASIARDYYRERANNAPCTLQQFNRSKMRG